MLDLNQLKEACVEQKKRAYSQLDNGHGKSVWIDANLCIDLCDHILKGATNMCDEIDRNMIVSLKLEVESMKAELDLLKKSVSHVALPEGYIPWNYWTSGGGRPVAKDTFVSVMQRDGRIVDGFHLACHVDWSYGAEEMWNDIVAYKIVK